MSAARKYCLLGAMAVVGGCASVPPQPNQLCAEIATFANSVTLDEPRSIRLETAWGRGLRGREDLLAEKQCDYAGYDPGRVLCEYLVRHSSTEFMFNNVVRVLSCHEGEPLFGFDRRAYVDELAGTIHAYGFTGVQEDIEISISFSTPREDRDAFLLISVERFELE